MEENLQFEVKKKKKKNNNKDYIYILLIVIAFFTGVIGTMLTFKLKPTKEVVNTTVENVTIKEENTIKKSIDKIFDAVVLIETYNSRGSQLGSGTGFVYKKDTKEGYILTNHHVIDEAKKIVVTLSDGEEVEATYKGSDEFTDLGVISIPADKVLKIAETGKSADSEIGDTVFTVGSPLGKDYMGTVTKGILSGKDRQIEVTVTGGDFIIDVLQTDAAINPGNSGGPLVNINGEVIGINSLKLVQDEIEGMGFALPIEYALAYTDRLEQGEEIVRPVLGVTLSGIEYPIYLERYGITIPDDVTEGIVIVTVEKGSSADKSKLQKGDIILKINDKKITSVALFRYNLYKYEIGDKLPLTINRDGKEMKIEVELIDNNLSAN